MSRCGLKHVGAWAVLLAAAVGGCRKEEPGESSRAVSLPPEPQLLEFPADLRADDETVNAFITEVIETCASGDYDAFRLLWSANDDPFPREQFHRAWRSVRQVKILGLKAVRDAGSGEIGYAAWALVELDPEVREPQRDVKILVKKEDGRWRLTRPHRSVPEDLFEPTATPEPPTTQPK